MVAKKSQTEKGHSEKSQEEMHCFRISAILKDLECEVEEILSFTPGIVNIIEIVTMNENY